MAKERMDQIADDVSFLRGQITLFMDNFKDLKDDHRDLKDTQEALAESHSVLDRKINFAYGYILGIAIAVVVVSSAVAFAWDKVHVKIIPPGAASPLTITPITE